MDMLQRHSHENLYSINILFLLFLIEFSIHDLKAVDTICYLYRSHPEQVYNLFLGYAL